MTSFASEEEKKQEEAAKLEDLPTLISQNPLTQKLIQNVDLISQNLKTDPQRTVQSTINDLDLPVFGRNRLNTLELLDQMLALNNSELSNKILNTDIFSVLVDLFFAFPNNSFLHQNFDSILMKISKDFSIE